ncbi:MAG: two-component sensor histidine kinase [Oscillospiraceae bacterium]|nr:two-component sensor histidine kinase [Oscillospiraceae bacterium]
MRKKLFLAILFTSLSSVIIFTYLMKSFGNTEEQLLVVILITILFIILLAYQISKRLVDTIQRLDPHHPMAFQTYHELTPLLRRLETQNETIRVQQKALHLQREDRDSMRREFTANVSHELKTPLTSISGFAELLKNGMVDPETVPEFASDIYDEAQRLISLVEDIMHLSQLDENSVPMERTEVDLNALTKQVVQRLSTRAKKSDISIRIEGTRVIVRGVELLLEELIYNLADNAIKYNHRSGQVCITTRYQTGHAVLTVQDSGIGIPPEHLPRVFERFYRVDKSHSKEVGGTGLGLSIVKHAAAYHNASVSIESTEHVGTTVTVRFMDI